MKDYIRDNGKVRMCASNVAQMNIFEIIYYKIAKDFVSDAKTCLTELIPLTFGLLFIMLFPISMPIVAYIKIRRAKRFMVLHKFKCSAQCPGLGTRHNERLHNA